MKTVGISSATEREDDARAALREAFAWGMNMRHKDGCDWANPASNFQKNRPCKCGLDALRTKLSRIAFGGKD